MKKLIAIIILLAGVIFFACKHGSTPTINNSFCASKTTDGTCPILPIDISEVFPNVGYESDLDSIHQPPIDVFSWQTFIALNWPADASGKPTGSSIADLPNAPRVWEFYQDPAEVFGHPVAPLVFQLGIAKRSGQKFLYLDSKSPRALNNGVKVDMNKLDGFQEADGHPLIDRNLNFTLYEIKMNPIEAKYVVDKKLTTLEGIYNYGLKNGNAISLPQSDSATNNVGSMEIKASWRILLPSAGDDTTRYYCRKATIFIDSAHTRNKKNLIITNVTVGLVGMHIIRKTTKLNIDEIWSTFEHIDNTPDDPQQAQQGSTVWSYYNPLCLNCLPNKAPDTLKGDGGQYIWETTMPYAIKYAKKAPSQTSGQLYGTQAVRTYPIYKYTNMLNRLWQDKLKAQGSVWANYRLVGSQWEKNDIPNGPKAPSLLGNTTLETFIQNNSSCISCHSGANVVFNSDTISTNMSFLFGTYAQGGLLSKKAKK